MDHQMRLASLRRVDDHNPMRIAEVIRCENELKI